MSSTLLPWKFDKETGARSPIVGSVKSGCLCPTFGAYGAAEERGGEPSIVKQVAKASARVSFRIVLPPVDELQKGII
jgi:hypothetical protein